MRSKIKTEYYNYLGKSVKVVIDRPLNSKHPKYGFVYELNCGFIPNTIAADGEEIDVYVIGVDEPVAEFNGQCIAIVHREDDDDDKLIVAPEDFQISDSDIIKKTFFKRNILNQ
jgi:inorganic pyrophosphatase